MNDKAPERRERVIRTPQDAADALTETFLANADAGEHEDNDQLIEAILEHKRKKRS